MFKLPTEHLEFLTESFRFGCAIAIFSREELEALQLQGTLLEALVQRRIRPANSEQEHFLQVDREEVEPVTVAERAWLRLKARREYEAEEVPTAPSFRGQDYGMVEFDADRCWW